MAHTTDPEARGSQQPAALSSLLAALPFNVLTIVLSKAGPHTRQVCSTFRDLHPPLLSLTPHGRFTPDALTAALAALPTSVTSLDLTHIRLAILANFTTAHITTIRTTLPHLQRLALPNSLDKQVISELLDTIHELPHLHTLHTLHATDIHLTSWAPLRHSSAATRLRSLTLRCPLHSPLLTAPPGTFPHLTFLSQHRAHHVLHRVSSAHCAALTAAAPALQSLHIKGSLALVDDAPLAPLAPTLTALSLYCDNEEDLHPPAQLLQHIGTLTNLRALSLGMCHTGWTPAEAGWLSRLTQLTQLAVVFDREIEIDDDDLAAMTVAPWAQCAAEQEPVPATALVLASVARDAARLPLLQDLHLHYSGACLAYEAFDSSSLGFGTPHSFVRHLAAVTQLRRLFLNDLPPCTNEVLQLTSLQQLSRLEIGLSESQVVGASSDGAQVHPGPLADPHGQQWPTCLLHALVASLPSLRTLGLAYLPPGHDLAGLLQRVLDTVVVLCLPELTDDGYFPALGLLGGMRQLRELELQLREGDDERLAAHLRLPGSLRRCYLPPSWPEVSEGLIAVVEGWRRQYPLVDFRLYGRADPLPGW